MVTGTPCAGNLVDSRLKELLPALPVVYVKAVPVQVCPYQLLLLYLRGYVEEYCKISGVLGVRRVLFCHPLQPHCVPHGCLFPSPLCSHHGSHRPLGISATIRRFTRHPFISQVSEDPRTSSWRLSRQKTQSVNGPSQELPCCCKQTTRDLDTNHLLRTFIWRGARMGVP